MQRRSVRSAPLPVAFNRLLVAWFASVTGDGMRFAALPLLALSLSPSPAAVSIVAAATTLPWLLIALPAGALVDRLDPAAVIAWANTGRAVATALLVVAVVAGWADIPLLCGVGFVLTAGETFADSAGQSLLVRLVPPDRLEAANARFVGSENIGLDLIGPLAAGALFAVAHWLPFAVAAAIFLATAAAVLALRGHRAAAGGAVASGVDGAASGSGRPGSATVPFQGLGPDGAGGAVAEPMEAAGPQRLSVRAGFRVIFGDRQLRVLVITVAIMSAAIAAAEGVLVVYSTSALRLPEALYPTLLACYSVGLVVAAAAMSRWGSGLRAGLMMVAAIAVIGASLLVMGAFPHPVVAWFSFLTMGAAGGVWNVLSASRRQRRTPPSMVARVSSTFRAISWGALPLGTALGGLLGETRTVPTVFVVAGLVVLALALVAGRFLVVTDGRPSSPLPGGQPSPVDRSGAAESV